MVILIGSRNRGTSGRGLEWGELCVGLGGVLFARRGPTFLVDSAGGPPLPDMGDTVGIGARMTK